MAIRELQPIKESSSDYEAIEARIIALFRAEVFMPLVRRLRLKPKAVLQNAKDPLKPLYDALQSGRVRYAAGTFTGSFGAAISKALRSAGAIWDPSLKGYRLADTRVTAQLRQAIASSEAAFKETVKALDDALRQKLPAEIAGKVKIAPIVDDLLWKTGKNIDSTLKGLTIPPDLSPDRRKRIADEWQNNLQLEIKKFADSEIQSLREKIQAHTFAGNRIESIVDEIQRSFGVTANKAKFLARQETNLLLSKFKETRYAEAGVTKYKWRCVAGSALHPVRPSHKALENGIFSWKDPPITTAPTEPARRNNPGEDFNCRCFALPIVEF